MYTTARLNAEILGRSDQYMAPNGKYIGSEMSAQPHAPLPYITTTTGGECPPPPKKRCYEVLVNKEKTLFWPTKLLGRVPPTDVGWVHPNRPIHLNHPQSPPPPNRLILVSNTPVKFQRD